MDNGLTLKRFITRANIMHDNKYDYSRVVYINNITIICIVCQDHGEFYQLPRDHLFGIGCKKCRKNTKTHYFSEI